MHEFNIIESIQLITPAKLAVLFYVPRCLLGARYNVNNRELTAHIGIVIPLYELSERARAPVRDNIYRSRITARR